MARVLTNDFPTANLSVRDREREREREGKGGRRVWTHLILGAPSPALYTFYIIYR